MNSIFNFFSPLSFVKSGIVSYNPYINYSWSQTLTVGGNQQIKDTGTAGTLLKLILTRKDCTKSIESIKVEDTTSKEYY